MLPAWNGQYWTNLHFLYDIGPILLYTAAVLNTGSGLLCLYLLFRFLRRTGTRPSLKILMGFIFLVTLFFQAILWYGGILFMAMTPPTDALLESFHLPKIDRLSAMAFGIVFYLSALLNGTVLCILLSLAWYQGRKNRDS